VILKNQFWKKFLGDARQLLITEATGQLINKYYDLYHVVCVYFFQCVIPNSFRVSLLLRYFVK